MSLTIGVVLSRNGSYYFIKHECVKTFIFLVFVCRKTIFDAPPEDPNYQPLPEEDRPGGFNWGDGQRVGAENEHED